MKSPPDHARALLEKAEHDLVAAEATLATGRAADMVCFHAQQAAEKSLKALLALKDVAYPWRHDLGELLVLTKAHFPETAAREAEILALAPYAVEIRYDNALAPSSAEARAALEAARQVHALARRLIGKGGRPG